MDRDDPGELHPGAHAAYRGRPVRLGPLSVEVEADDPNVVARFEHLLAALGPPLPGAPAVRVSIRDVLPSDHRPGTCTSAVDGEFVVDSQDLGEHELAITRVLNKRRLDAEPDLLHIHGAAVAKTGRAVLIPGRPGSGKSTLTAALIRCGWQYVTDEQAVVQPEDGLLIAYPRPITLGASSWPMFAGVPGIPTAPLPAGGRSRIEVAPQDLGSIQGPGAVGISAVVVPRFVGNRADELQRIETAAETVEVLSSSCHDLERLGVTGMTTLVELAANCNGWRLDFDGLPAAVRRIEEAFEASPRPKPLHVRHILPRTSTQPTRGSVIRAQSAHAWAFDDGSAVAYLPDTRTLARLDDAGVALWERLGDPQPIAELQGYEHRRSAAQARIHRWLNELLRAGLVGVADS